MSKLLSEPEVGYQKERKKSWRDLEKIQTKRSRELGINALNAKDALEQEWVKKGNKEEWSAGSHEKEAGTWPSIEKREFHTLRSEERGKLDLESLAKEQDYHGTDLKKVEGKWPGDESYEELLELL